MYSKKIFNLIVILIIISCNLDSNKENKEQTDFLTGGTWATLPYPIPGFPIFTMEFNENRTIMDFTLTHGHGEKRSKAYEMEIKDNILSYYDTTSKQWLKGFKIVKHDKDGNYSNLYTHFYINREETDQSVRFTRYDLYDYDFQDFINKDTWLSEKISIEALHEGFGFIDSRFNSEYVKNKKVAIKPESPTNNELENQLVVDVQNIIDSFNNFQMTDISPEPSDNYQDSESDLQTKMREAMHQALAESVTSTGDLIDLNDNLPKEYQVSLAFDFDLNMLKISVYLKDEIKFNINKSFKLEGRIIHISNINDELMEWRSMEYKDSDSFKLSNFCTFSKR